MFKSISYFQGHKLTQEDIINLERQLEHEIPNEYARFLLAYNGGMPQQNCHDAHGTAGRRIGSVICVEMLYSLAGKSEVVKETHSIEWNYSVYRGRIPENFLPIGEDGGGNQVCISLYGEDAGCVWYWDHNKEIIPPDYSNCYKVADNFQALLDGLFEYDYENGVRIP